MLVSNGQVIPDSLFSETSPVLTNGYFYANDGLDLTGRHAAFGLLYRTQPSISTVVDKVANSASRLSIKTWDTSSDTGKILANDSPYGKLIANPSLTLSPFTFWRWVQSTYEIYGEAYLLKVRPAPGKPPMALIPMHPTRTVVRRDLDGVVRYVFTLGVASAGIYTADADDVIPFQRYNPDTQLRGMSRLEPLRSTLLNEDAARRAQASMWAKGARPSMLLTSSKTVSQTAATKLQAQFSTLNSGPDNAGRVAVLEDGMTAQIVQLNMEEMQYIEGRKLNMQEVCMVYDVPPPVVHILDHATFSNITEQMRSMYRDTMMPRLCDFESVLDFHLRPDFDHTGSLQAKFALDDVLRGDFETRAEAVAKLISSGIMKPAEARMMFDLDDAGKIADMLFANAALVPLGDSGKQAVDINGNLITPAMENPTNRPVSDGSDDSQGDDEQQLRSLAGVFGREKTVNGVKKAIDNFLAAGSNEKLVAIAAEKAIARLTKGKSHE